MIDPPTGTGDGMDHSKMDMGAIDN
jgi:hypothetical protein